MFTTVDVLRAYNASLEDVGDIEIETLELFSGFTDGLPIHDGRLTTSLPPAFIVKGVDE